MIDQVRYGIFDMLNEQFFNNELPSLPIFHVSNSNLTWHGCHIERTNDYGHVHYRILMNTIELLSSSLYIGVMAHEMVHHWQIVKNIPGKDHGKRFRKKAKKIEKVLGIPVIQPVKYNDMGTVDTTEAGIVKEFLETDRMEVFEYED